MAKSKQPPVEPHEDEVVPVEPPEGEVVPVAVIPRGCNEPGQIGPVERSMK